MSWYKKANVESKLIDVAKDYAEKDPDYGILFWDDCAKKVFWVMGDSADYSWRDVEDDFRRVKGVKDVEVADEGYPPRGQGYQMLYPNKKRW